MIQVEDPLSVDDEARWALMRLNRDALLKNSDWRVSGDLPNRDEWAQWRQYLRDFPSTWIPADYVEFIDPPEA
jgi:hypothetical protein